MPRSTGYLGRLVAADEPPARVRAPYRRGWGARAVLPDEATRWSRDHESAETPAPATAPPPATSRPILPESQSKRGSDAPQQPSDAVREDRATGPARGSEPVSTRSAIDRTAAPRATEQPVPAMPVLRRHPSQPPAPAAAARPPVPEATRRTGERGGLLPLARDMPTRAADPTLAGQGARAPRASSLEPLASTLRRARPVQATAALAATVPRAAADRRARAAQFTGLPSIRIGTIDVHVAAPSPALAPAAELVRPQAKPPAPDATERLSRPAAVFGLAQG